MQKSVSWFLGSLYTIIGLFVLFFMYNNYGFKTFDSAKQKKHRVVLIVLDALRHDYLEITKSNQIDLRNLNKMAITGARVMQVVPAYPTVTMVNHQTLVTGLYSPYHGITQNTFNDSSMGFEQFSMDNQSSLNEPRWYHGYPDPIWVTCEKNPHCKSGSMLWPNTDASINGYRPWRQVGQYFILNEKWSVIYPYERRVDELIGWMTNDLIDFGLLYFDEPDATAHKYGPLHANTLSKLQEMDGHIGRLIEGLHKVDLLSSTDLILTGDHGMTAMSKDRVIQIDKFVPPNLYQSTYSYPVGVIYPNEGKFDEVFDLYSKASEHIKVYKREHVPEHLHYTDNPHRISPIVTVVDLGWFVNSSHYNQTPPKGSHGYTPDNNDMKTTLLAIGPSFKHITLNSTAHVDLYSLMTHLLGLKANPNNGSFARISAILTDSALQWTRIEDKWVYNRVVMVVYLALLIQVITTVAVVVSTFCHKKKQRYHTPRITAKFDREQSQALITDE